jgi:hypothetical protein
MANDLARRLVDDEEQDQWRTAVLAALQFVPVFGGSTSQALAHFWSSATETRIKETLVHMSDELKRHGRDIEYVTACLRQSEPAQVFMLDGLQASCRTVSIGERQWLGRLLARGLSTDARKVADRNYMLRRWDELDAVEKLIFVLLGDAMRDRKKAQLDFTVLGNDYFSGAAYYERSYKEVIHRGRINHLIATGLVRPHDEKGWAEGKYGYQLEHLRHSRTGEALYALIADDPGSQNPAVGV